MTVWRLINPDGSPTEVTWDSEAKAIYMVQMLGYFTGKKFSFRKEPQ